MATSSSALMPYKKYGECTPLSYVYHNLKMLSTLPFFICYRLLTRDGTKPVTRIISDTIVQRVTTMPYNIVQRVIRETLPVYNGWAKGESCIEPVPNIAGANLLWIGQKKTERVILYVHGGGYGMPYLAGALPFWRYVKDKVTERVRTDGIGMAVFSYSLIPEGIFPTPLKQLIQAILYLTEGGTPASDIYLVGDSAGANLILQLLAHSLHPVPDVPQSISPDTKFGGIYLMSPWVDPLGETFTPSMPHATIDIFYPAAYKLFGTVALIGVPLAQRMYMQMIEIPEGFFRDLKQNMLVSFAGRETLRDSIKFFYERHFQGMENVSLAFDEDGVHDDPYGNFNMFGARPRGELTVAIIDWLVKSLSAELDNGGNLNGEIRK